VTDALSSPRTYRLLAAFQVGDTLACAIPLPYITKAMDDLGVPPGMRWILPVVKAASVVGLLSVGRYPALARLTTAMLTVYFVLAVGAHVRVRDRVVNTVPAATFLLTYAAMTAKGPNRA
jgi:hypothetical protein